MNEHGKSSPPAVGPEARRAEEERLKRRRMRSIAIALALGFLVALFYAATIVHMGPNALNRPL